MVPNILSACYEELLNGDDSTMMKGLSPLDFSAVNSSGFMEIPPNLSVSAHEPDGGERKLINYYVL